MAEKIGSSLFNARGEPIGGNGGFNSAEFTQLFNMAFSLVKRAELAAKLGQSFGGDRDLYKALGYKKTLNFADYNAFYERADIAERIVHIKPDKSWAKPPQIVESESDETDFEREWIELNKKHELLSHMKSVDRLSGIGEYGVLFLGFNDAQGEAGLKQPARRSEGMELLYLNSFHQGNADISSWDEDVSSPNFGKPETFKLKVEPTPNKTKTIEVHWTRCIYVVDEEAPRLKNAYNRIEDLQKIVGGSAEMFWRGASRDLFLSANDGTQIEDKDALQDDIEAYLHKLKRYLAVENMDAKSLAPAIASPKDHVDSQFMLLAPAVSVPKRMLMGAEVGELASTQDITNFLQDMEGRRTDHNEPNILRPTVDRLIEFGVLSEPREGYSVVWDPLVVLSEKDRAEIAGQIAKALESYLKATLFGVEDIVPPNIFLKEILGLDQAVIDKIQEVREEEQVMVRLQAIAEKQGITVDRLVDNFKKVA